MRDQNDRTFGARQVTLQPCRRVCIQMVRWLVENGDVGACDEQLCERDPPAFTTASEATRPVDVENPQLVQETECFVTTLPSAEPLDRIVELCLLHQERIVLRGVAIREPGRDLFVSKRRCPPCGERIFDDSTGAGVWVELRLLREVPDRQSSANTQRASVGRLQAGENPRERRFARAVCADERDLLAAKERKRRLLEHDLRPESLSKALGC